MSYTRLIARLDIKGPNLIKGIRLEGFRVVGRPQEHALKYYQQGIDELLYVDAVASLYGRNSLNDLIRQTIKDVFIPLTVGGGVRSVEDVNNLLRSGADKVAINTAAIQNPELISQVAERFGSQCMVLSIQAKQASTPCGWEAYTEGGRERSGIDVLEWAQKGAELGAGEILLTSVDQEGTRKGFDRQLVQMVSQAVSIPVIASGGMGSPQDLVDIVKEGHADAVAMADILHFERHPFSEIREHAVKEGIAIKPYE